MTVTMVSPFIPLVYPIAHLRSHIPWDRWRTCAVGPSRRCKLSLRLGEARGLADGTQVETRQSPLPLLMDKHKRDAKLTRDAVAAIGGTLHLTADRDGGLAVHAHRDLIQVERVVCQVTGLMARQPLVLGQHESERSDSDEVIRECPLKESGIPAQFGRGPGVCKTRHLLFGVFPVHRVTPFCRQLIVSSQERPTCASGEAASICPSW